MMSSHNQISLFPILLVNFISTLGFSIVLPFLVFVVMKFGGNAIVYGFLAATYPAFQLIGAPVLGRRSDIYGRRKVLLLSNAGTSIGWILFLFALFLPPEKVFNVTSTFIGSFLITLPILALFLARAIDGITGGNTVANAYLSDISTDKNRSKNFAKMAIASNLGFIVGPALAGILGGTNYGAILPVLAALILSIITLIVLGFILKESKPFINRKVIPDEGGIRRIFAQECKECYETVSPKKRWMRNFLELKYTSFLLVLYFLIFLGFNIYYASFPAHASKDLKWSVTQLGIFYAILSGIMVLVQGPVLRKALRKFSEEKLVIIGSVILGTNFILFVSSKTILVYCAVVLFAVGNGLMWPSYMSILSKRAGTELQGSVQGLAGSFGGLASIVGLTMGGFLYNLVGGDTFLVSGGVIFTVFTLSFKLLRMKG